MVALSLEHLFSNAILPLLIKVGKVCRAKILPLEILCVPLLPILPHFLNLLRGMFANARIVSVGADDHVLPYIAAATVAAATSTAKFRPGVVAATAKARPTRAGATRRSAAAWSAAVLGVPTHGQLGLARVDSDGRRRPAACNGASMKSLG
jgi:hypothetical protein